MTTVLEVNETCSCGARTSAKSFYTDSSAKDFLTQWREQHVCPMRKS